MPINSSPLENTEYRSYKLEITDKDELAKCVALLAVGHFRHVQKILDRLSPPGTFFPTGAITKAIDEFSKTGTGHLENRDGWIFQFMSWIALAARTRGAILLDAPHPMPSQKGFDGLAVSLNPKSPLSFALSVSYWRVIWIGMPARGIDRSVNWS